MDEKNSEKIDGWRETVKKEKKKEKKTGRKWTDGENGQKERKTRKNRWTIFFPGSLAYFLIRYR